MRVPIDRTLKISDVERRAAVRTLSGHTKGVYAFDWSPSFKFIVSCGMDRHALLWNPFSAKPMVRRRCKLTLALKAPRLSNFDCEKDTTRLST